MLRPRLSTHILAATLASALALAPVACGDDEGDQATADEGATIGMMSFANDPLFVSYEKGAQAKADELGADLNFARATQYETSNYISTFNAAAARNPDAVIGAAFEAEAMQGPIEQVANRDIPVVFYDTNVADTSFDGFVTYVSSQYKQLGEQTGEELIRAIKEDRGKLSGEVLAFSVSPGNQGLEDHLEGFMSVMEQHPDIDVLPVQYTQGEQAKTNSVVKATLARNPDLAGIYMGPPGGGALGGMVALRQLGKAGEIPVVMLDASPEAVAELKVGRVESIVSSDAEGIGAAAVQAAVDAVNGKDSPPEILLAGCIITKETLDDPANRPCLYGGK